MIIKRCEGALGGVVLLASLLCHPGQTLSFAPASTVVPLRSRIVAASRASTIQTELFDKSQAHKPVKSSEKKATVLHAVTILAGTSIGGGFLALPYATAPPGLLPSAVGMVVCWMFLLVCGLSLADATLARMRAETNPALWSQVSVLSVARSAGGSALGNIAGALFAVSCTLTLAAQNAKSADLLGRVFSSAPFPVLLAAPALLTGGITFGLKKRVVERVNTGLTVAVIASFAGLIFSALRRGLDLSLLGRADWGALVPGLTSGAHGGWCIPVFLQVLCVLEVVPVVCARLGPDRPKDVRKSLVLGSLVPLVICLAWCTVATGIVPYAPGTAGLVFDPVDALLAGGSGGQSVAFFVACLGVAAIGTTFIGMYLTFAQFARDVTCLVRSRGQGCTVMDKRIGNAFTMALPALLALLSGKKVSARTQGHCSRVCFLAHLQINSP